MKKLLAIAVIAVMSISLLAGCSAKPVYKDGTYTAYSDATDRGYVKAEVTIAKDKITGVKLSGTDNLGLEKTAAYAWADYHTMKTELPKRFVEKNSWDVDVWAKATGSSNQAKQAVLRAMQKARVNPTTTAKYFDGVYMAISDKTDKGWTIVWVTIGNDKITGVNLHATTPAKELDAEGKPVKDAEGKDVIKKDAAGNVVFERKAAAYPWPAYHEARVELPKRFVAKNSADVEIVTGATGTSNQAKQAVAEALKKAMR